MSRALSRWLALSLVAAAGGSLASACSSEDGVQQIGGSVVGSGGSSGKKASGGASGASASGGPSAQAGQTGAAGQAQGGQAGCLPSCLGRYCGAPDGCGSRCTDCPSSSEICDAKTFTCVSVNPGCTPSCAGKTCGQGDGCGGKCKVCPLPTTVCNEATGACETPGQSCTPSCAGKTCGQSNGCGGVCTDCPAGSSCDTNSGTCVSQSCQPSCDGKVCGQSDGCTGVCTSCPDPAATCDSGTGQCKVICKPDCSGKTCGQDNGCGGKCGGCGPGELCDTDAWVCKPPCKSSCDSKACGDDDGCGGKCSSCPAGQFCSPQSFACEACALSCADGCTVFKGIQVCRCPAGQASRYDGTCVDDPMCAQGCGDHGTCVLEPTPIGAFYSCACEPGYIDGGGRCVAERRFYCRDRDGSLREMGALRCSLDDSQFEVCRDVDGDGLQEWVASGSPACPNGNSCSACKDWGCKDGVSCPEGMLCIESIHEQPVYACTGGTCDCSNCGTCNPGDFSGYQAHCGGPSGGPATLACKQPCPPGYGCIPFTVGFGGQGYPGICYPAEGCFSAPVN